MDDIQMRFTGPQETICGVFVVYFCLFAAGLAIESGMCFCQVSEAGAATIANGIKTSNNKDLRTLGLYGFGACFGGGLRLTFLLHLLLAGDHVGKIVKALVSLPGLQRLELNNCAFTRNSWTESGDFMKVNETGSFCFLRFCFIWLFDLHCAHKQPQ